MPKIAARYTVTLDRLDGGEPIEEQDVLDVQLRLGTVTILDRAGRLFSGDAWASLEVRRIEEGADVVMAVKAPPRPRRQTRAIRQTRRSK
jgi:hypothetical protein